MTDCHQLKMIAEDGKQRVTDAANAETLQGGNIVKKARVELEQKTGRKVVTQDNYLPQVKNVTRSKKNSRDSDNE